MSLDETKRAIRSRILESCKNSLEVGQSLPHAKLSVPAAAVRFAARVSASGPR